MNFPSELKYTKDHEWLKVEGNIITIGITEFAQKELGDIVYVELESEGEILEDGEVFGTIEAVKTVSDLFMPVAGKVTEINSKLENNPEIVNSDSYGEGWMIKIKFDGSTDELLSAEQYQELIGE